MILKLLIIILFSITSFAQLSNFSKAISADMLVQSLTELSEPEDVNTVIANGDVIEVQPKAEEREVIEQKTVQRKRTQLSAIEMAYSSIDTDHTLNLLISTLNANAHYVLQSEQVIQNNSMNQSDPESPTESVTQSTQQEVTQNEDSEKKVLHQIGYDSFSMDANTQLMNGVAPNNYRLTFGDSLNLFIYGKKEQIIEISVDKHGDIYLPSIGLLTVGGLTLAEASDKIKHEFSKRYVNFEFKLKLNTIQKVLITVAGDVRAPGTYTVNKFDSVLSVLTLAGGVHKTGSLRTIHVIRDGKKTMAYDLYELLIKGTGNHTIVLHPNDVVFVPKIGDTAAIGGAVHAPGIYEVKPGETLHDLMSFASGMTIEAYPNSIYMNRLNNNFSRRISVIHDKSVKGLKKKLTSAAIQNGDVVMIRPHTGQDSGYINIEGNIHIPGKYEYKKGLVLGDILNQANGVKLNTHARVQVYRYLNDNERELKSVDIANVGFALEDQDIIRVFNNFEIIEESNIEIIGEVSFPGKYKFLKNMTVSDIMLLAQPKELASVSNIEVSRVNGQSSKTFYVDTTKNSEFELNRGDKISVKLDNQRDQMVEIKLDGEFRFPGIYRVTKGTRLSDVIEKAGGYLPSAFLKGAIFSRKSVKNYDQMGQTRVIDDEKKRYVYDQSHLGSLAMDTQTAIAIMMQARQQSLNYLEERANLYPGRIIIDLANQAFERQADNFIIEDGDSLVVPTVPESIHLIGGVQQSISIAYNNRYSINDYVNTVGGFSKYADSNNIYIFKSSGKVDRNIRVIEPGDVVYVPERVIISFNWLQFLTNITSIISNAVTSVALINSLN